MSDKKYELPRDLRCLCGGIVENPDGSQRVLLDPVKAYFNLCTYVKGMEQLITDPDIPIEENETLLKHLDRAKQDLPKLKQRILDNFKSRPHNSITNNADRIMVDRGAESKVKKALADIKSGYYVHSNKSKTLKAVYRALLYRRVNGRMPSHQELMELGYNAQQATDAGKWLAMMAGSEPYEESLFLPLHQAKQGRQKK